MSLNHSPGDWTERRQPLIHAPPQTGRLTSEAQEARCKLQPTEEKGFSAQSKATETHVGSPLSSFPKVRGRVWEIQTVFDSISWFTQALDPS